MDVIQNDDPIQTLLMLPYPIGWSLGIWGPGSPGWMLWLGIGVGLWYWTILVIALNRSAFVSSGIVIPAILEWWRKRVQTTKNKM